MGNSKVLSVQSDSRTIERDGSGTFLYSLGTPFKERTCNKGMENCKMSRKMMEESRYLRKVISGSPAHVNHARNVMDTFQGNSSASVIEKNLLH